ncbi:hypothetical protein JYU34_007874 [Plutella xylostella]|uniref:Uncharacterized protein n=1 Tax=Plutella xylostella TaxID=51655 RepID=A0ABQ7QRF9_PLUXY|nr:hypothetical protein JYU34_007874 [Plutella xylostella]
MLSQPFPSALESRRRPKSDPSRPFSVAEWGDSVNGIRLQRCARAQDNDPQNFALYTADTHPITGSPPYINVTNHSSFVL